MRQPVAERIAEPRRLRAQRFEAELVPDRLGALHVFLLRQRQRRHVALHGRIHQQRRILFAVVLALGPVALAAVRHDLHVLDRVHAIGHRPQQRIGVVGGDVLVDRDADLAAIALEEGGAIERAPDLGARHALLDRDDGDAQQAGQRLVQGDALDAADAERVAQMREEQRLVGDALDHARFARRHLADIGRDDRLLAMGDRGHLHRHVEFLERHVAVRLAERRFRLEPYGVDQPLDHQLGFGRHQQVDGARAHDVDRLAGKPAGDGEFVDADRQLLRTHERDIGRAAEHDGAGHRLAALLVLEVMLVAAGAADARRHAHHQPVRRLQRRAVGAHVLHAGLGIAGDDVGRGQRRRAVEARRRDRDRQQVEAVAFALQRLALDHDLLADRLVDQPRLDRIGDGMIPLGLDVLDLARPCRCCRSPDWRRWRRPQPGMSYLRPRPSTMLVNRKALRSASSRPPTNCQRTSGCNSESLSIGRSMVRTQAALFQRLQMLVQIAIASRRLRHGRRSQRYAGQHTGLIGWTTMPRQIVSGTILMAPQGHSAAQSPQPLQ